MLQEILFDKNFLAKVLEFKRNKM